MSPPIPVRKLTPEQEEEVVRRVTAGETLTAISKWLLAEHGITISRQSLAKRTREKADEQAVRHQIRIQTQLEKTNATDLDRLEVVRTQVAERASTLPPSEVRHWLQAKRLEANILLARIKFSDGTKIDPSGLSDAQLREMAREALRVLA